MKIALAQINTTIGDLKGNIELIKKYYKLLSKNSDIVVFPELCTCSYPLVDLLEREDFVNTELEFINNELLPIINESAIIIGALTKNTEAGKRFFNSALFIHKNKIIATVNKTLLPSYDMFDEKRYFEEAKSWDLINFKNKKIGLTICEDMWKHASSDLNNLYLVDPMNKYKKADIIINISSSPYFVGKDEIRHSIISKHSNNKSFIYVNSVGANDSVIFDGKSKVYKNSKLVYELSGFSEDSYIYDTDKNEDKALLKRNDLEDIYNAISLGIKDYVLKNNLKGVVIGLSGGIDSAICTVLAVNAIGKENVKCITMPSIYSSTGSVSDSQELCKNLDLELMNIPITDVFESSKASINNAINLDLAGLAKENIQSRIRALFLNAYANSHNGYVLLATGNKSEIATGYCTLYGDTCGALAPIGDLYKTQVYDLARFINKDSVIIPTNIITKAPSAELKENQFDQDSLPDYSILDAIIKGYIEENKTKEDLNKIYDESLVTKVIKLINMSEFKRKQMPPILKVSKRAFNIDRRTYVVNKFC